MCAIDGLIHFGPRSEQNIQIMGERMKMRGPDAGGVWHNEDSDVWFGHRRLSIIDLTSTGDQPFTSRSGRKTMVFNGEIYNYRKIREMLETEYDFHDFRGSSDTEVLLEAIEVMGMDRALSLCKGMFAIAVYDHEERSVSFARDRIGEKPLYYGFVGNAFAFASDIGAIAALEGFANPIRKEVLPIYFVHGYIPAPYTIYEDICKLEPGRIMELKAPYGRQDLHVRTYWSVEEAAVRGQQNLFRGSFEEASAELERLIRSSVRDQMLSSDVPVGAFLSAGIDSSTIVSLMKQEETGKVKSFTIGMQDPRYNEAEIAREIAKHLGTEHTEKYISEEDCKAVIPLLPGMFGEPFADSSQIPTYLVSRMTKEHVTVALSGDAGDELFCGYTSYASVERIWNKIRNYPAGLRRTASALVLGSPLASRELFRIKGTLLRADSPEELYRISRETDPLAMRIVLQEVLGEELPYVYTRSGKDVTGEVCHDIMLMDMQMYHPDDILVKVDRCAMANSLESRVPLLDRDVVEFAWTLPVDYLRKDGKGKRILRDILYRYVPEELVDRPKKGFSIPIMKWLKEPALRRWAENLLDPGRIRAQGILDPDVVQQIWRNYTEKNVWCVQIWYLLMFQAWMENEYRRV